MDALDNSDKKSWRSLNQSFWNLKSGNEIDEVAQKKCTCILQQCSYKFFFFIIFFMWSLNVHVHCKFSLSVICLWLHSFRVQQQCQIKVSRKFVCEVLNSPWEMSWFLLSNSYMNQVRVLSCGYFLSVMLSFLTH